MKGIFTGNNERFLRHWYEISFNVIGTDWIKYSKGGKKRKWYGNVEHVVNWKNDGEELQKFDGSGLGAQRHYGQKHISWSGLTSGDISFRYESEDIWFDDVSPSIVLDNHSLNLLSLLNNKVVQSQLNILNPTLHYQIGDIKRIPYISDLENLTLDTELIISLTKLDWDIFERSWGFIRNPFLMSLKKNTNLLESYKSIRNQWRNIVTDVRDLEVTNNDIFIKVYGLEKEFTPEVPLKEITLTCNPSYRYGGDATEEQLEQRLQSDTIAELISYAIGCMMGRYSLDREGLVYAHEGNVGFDELVAEGAYKTFPADEDGILPLLDEERFSDDVYSRFEQFIATAWDKEVLHQNLDFIAESLRLYNIKPKNGESSAQTIRRYLSNHFYKDQHLKTYKSRPIYWLFSSGKQKAFECLVYMHRFNDATLAKMRTQYVLPLMGQLTARAQFLSNADKDTSLSPAEKTKYAKEADNLHKKLNELKDFDAELKHHIEQKISIDLDDGVKVNYGKFAKLLAEAKKVTGNKE